MHLFVNGLITTNPFLKILLDRKRSNYLWNTNRRWRQSCVGITKQIKPR